jgi:RNA polymerase sigma-70 factor (ECF subfamily)
LTLGAELIEHIPRLRRYARALTRDVNQADDLVQDTLERALVKLDLWRPGTDLRAWLFTLMHNLFVNQVRAGRLPEADLDAAQDIPVNGGQMDAMALRDIHAALGRLPAEQREVILLVGLEQFGYAEAARILEVPLGTVMSRLSRGRERLRQLLAGGSLADEGVGEAAVKLKVIK